MSKTFKQKKNIILSILKIINKKQLTNEKNIKQQLHFLSK